MKTNTHPPRVQLVLDLKVEWSISTFVSAESNDIYASLGNAIHKTVEDGLNLLPNCFYECRTVRMSVNRTSNRPSVFIHMSLVRCSVEYMINTSIAFVGRSVQVIRNASVELALIPSINTRTLDTIESSSETILDDNAHACQKNIAHRIMRKQHCPQILLSPEELIHFNQTEKLALGLDINDTVMNENMIAKGVCIDNYFNLMPKRSYAVKEFSNDKFLMLVLTTIVLAAFCW